MAYEITISRCLTVSQYIIMCNFAPNDIINQIRKFETKDKLLTTVYIILFAKDMLI